MLRVAVVEDEWDLCEEYCQFLQLSGIHATGMTSGAQLDGHLQNHPCDVVILDVNLPGEDGFAIAARLRERPGLGVIMVTSRAARDDRVRGLRTGADAYLVKPVDLMEMVATLESVCRRTRQVGAVHSDPAAVAGGGWCLRQLGWELAGPNGQSVALTATERDLLVHLAKTPGHPVDRATLLGQTGKIADEDLRKLDAVVRRLRRKAEDTIGLRLPVRAAHGVGYAATERIDRND